MSDIYLSKLTMRVFAGHLQEFLLIFITSGKLFIFLPYRRNGPSLNLGALAAVRSNLLRCSSYLSTRNHIYQWRVQ